MRFGGWQKFSLLDYPEKISTILFTQGCNLRCPYCHNSELVEPDFFSSPISQNEIFLFLKKRRSQLDAVVITGGEPTFHSDLIDFLKKIKKMSYSIKLDTNGSFPEVIKKIIELKLVDYLAMDIKAPFKKYQEITCSEIEPEKIQQSINLIMNSGLNYEFRTTVVRSQLNKEDILEIGKMIKGAKLFILQKFVPLKTLSKEFLKKATYFDVEFEVLKNDLEKFVVKCLVR